MNENQNYNDQISTSSVNQIVSEVIPINEVKIENEVAPPEVNNITPVSNNNSEPPKNNKLSTILLILLFVFLFSFVMGMPYINEFITNLKFNNSLSKIEQEAIQEEKKQKEEAKKDNSIVEPEIEKTNVLVCTASVISTEAYTSIETKKLYYNSKNEILITDSISKYNFKFQDETYNSLKKQCNEDSLKYATHEGFTMECSYDDVNLEISHNFDLETFKPIIDGSTTIDVDLTYKQDLNTIKNNLISQGYTCE